MEDNRSRIKDDLGSSHSKLHTPGTHARGSQPGGHLMNGGSQTRTITQRIRDRNEESVSGPPRIWSTLSTQARDTQAGGHLMNGGGLVLILASQPPISIPITPPLMPLHTSYPPSYPPDSGGSEEADDSLTHLIDTVWHRWTISISISISMCVRGIVCIKI